MGDELEMNDMNEMNVKLMLLKQRIEKAPVEEGWI